MSFRCREFTTSVPREGFQHGTIACLTISRIRPASANDAPYVPDGLILCTRELPVRELNTDRGGASDQVTGMCRLMPVCVSRD